jgi:hypothetical protein
MVKQKEFFSVNSVFLWLFVLEVIGVHRRLHYCFLGGLGALGGSVLILIFLAPWRLGG